jgi:Ca2+-binding EF-hand superfamily protein
MDAHHRQRALGLLVLAPLAACAASDRAVHVSEALAGAGIALAELRASGDDSFARLDADGDGMITETEFRQGGPGVGVRGPGERAFVIVHRRREADEAEVDVDVRRETSTIRAFRFELGEQGDAAADADAIAFAAIDADGDGMLSLEEYENRPRHLTTPHVAVPRLGIPTEQIELALDAAGDAFRSFDANEDGVISRDEWPSPERHLTELDLDGDGFVALEELAPGENRRIVINRGESSPE